MGGGIAQSLAIAGFNVTITDKDPTATAAAFDRLVKESKQFEDEGLFAPGSTELVQKNLRSANSIYDAVKDADFVEEAVFEIVDVKKKVLAAISAAAPREAIIGTNTSTIPVRELAPAVKYPDRFLTVHFSNPAPFIPGVEIVGSRDTRSDVVDEIKAILLRCGREGARVKDAPGMVMNRLQYVLLKEAFSIVEEGVATMEDVDTLVRTTFGFRLGFFGPFAIADQAGLDVYVNCFKTFENAFGSRFNTPDLLKKMVNAGRLGTKNGKGLTGDYDDEAKAKLISYRNRAYVMMGRLLRDLGGAPKGISYSDN